MRLPAIPDKFRDSAIIKDYVRCSAALLCLDTEESETGYIIHRGIIHQPIICELN
jgi:hypothetical protein